MTMRQDMLRWILEKLIRCALWAIGPRMTLWSLYCVFARLWGESIPVEVQADGTNLMRTDQGGPLSETWADVCSHLSKCSDVCEDYEVAAGLGHRSEPFMVHSGGESSSSGGLTITAGPRTCQSWIKTTDKFPWSKT